MQINAGEFTKIIGTQEKAVGQLMDVHKEANNGQDQMITNAIGGMGNIEEGKKAGKMKEFATQTADEGLTQGRTTGEDKAGGKMLSKPIEDMEKEIDKRTKNATASMEATTKEQQAAGANVDVSELVRYKAYGKAFFRVLLLFISILIISIKRIFKEENPITKNILLGISGAVIAFLIHQNSPF